MSEMGDKAGLAGGVMSLGTGLATGNILQGLIGAAGIGMSLFGGNQAKKAAAEEQQAQAQLGQEEQQMLGVQRQQMGLDYQRQQRQLARNAIQTSAQGKAAAVSSGSQFGSGEKGGQAQISGQANTQAVDLSQNYQLGLQANDIAVQEANTAIQIGQANTNINTGKSEQGLGQSIVSSSGELSRMGTFLGGLILPS